MLETSSTNAKTDLAHLSVPEALKQLGVDPKAGLTAAEARKRLAHYGPNSLEEKKKSQLARLSLFGGSASRKSLKGARSAAKVFTTRRAAG